MKIICLLLLVLSFSSNVLADTTLPTAIVSKLKGEVLFENKPLKIGDAITQVGKILTKDSSYVQLKIDKWKNLISIGPNSTMVLNFSDERKYTLEDGVCRWKSFAKSESKGKIFTKRAAMGVRGTDFFLKANPVLGETEIIMFDGEVQMENIADSKNTALIKKGQWGGIGGRFGEKISPILDLPQVVLDSTDKALE